MATNKTHIFERFARKATVFSGSTIAFITALTIILIWIITGPLFNFSDTWQLVINTGTTVVTFLMVFLIQRAQNKDSKALHLKLNELVAALNGPSNRLIDVEDLSEEELDTLSSYYKKLAEMAKKEKTLTLSHSIEEAVELHKIKYKRHKQ
ncbi:MAG TPA: low affinity iron permease family protein [Flavobacteriales bacterium]|nr:low affinity iron permease family protein [Flavobacteriales bacterium]